MIKFPRARTARKVPLGRSQIDWSNPLTRGLFCCMLPGVSLIDIVNHISFGGSNPPLGSVSFTGDGVGLFTPNTGANGSGYYSTSLPFALRNWQTLSAFWRGVSPDSSDPIAQQIIIGMTAAQPNASPFFEFDLNVGSSFSASYQLQVATNGGIFQQGIANRGTTNGLLDFTMSMDPSSATGVNAYVNGSSVFNGGPTGATFPSASNGQIYFGGPTDCTHNAVMVWANRLLSANDALQLHNDPYQFIIPVDADIAYMPVAPQPPLPPIGFAGFPNVTRPVQVITA